ncbi:MAG: FAD-dependent pyridine nucleotide-disulfide oxidoreductase [Firmicutes bacterium]|nr:FAD-dependent pyridine nucleotide-disulfide oxidoreductase [Bacillota bacterium]
MDEIRIPAGFLKDNKMKSLSVGQNSILLAKVEGQYYALGPVCPHYGGPLQEGTLHDGRIVCPWHQASFAVQTGDLLEPPALDGLPKYEIRQEGEEYVVNVPDMPEKTRTMSMCACNQTKDRRTFVVVGAGAAAAAAVETLRQESFAGRILMIGAEDRVPYDRPSCSKDYLAGKFKSADKYLPLRPVAFYEKYGIERLRARVTEFDVASRRILLDDGMDLTADAVLIATGAVPRRLTVPGADLPGVFTLRSWDDCNAIINALQGSKKAVVIGDGFIGMEAASSLAHRGLSVTVVERGSVPFVRVFGEEIGMMVKKIHEENGTVFRSGRSISAITGSDRAQQVHLDDGSILEVDLVLVGIGSHLSTDFIKGVQLVDDGSVNVDEHFRISDGVYAAGDIARYPNPVTGERIRIEHWCLAEKHGRAVALSMLSRPQLFNGVPFFWTEHFGFTLSYAGHADEWDEFIVDGDIVKRDFMAFYVNKGHVLAAATTHSERMGPFMELARLGRLPPASLLQKNGAEVLRLLLADKS